MADKYTEYLRRIGVAPQYDKMTEAQIAERNKSNPLGGYGLMSGQDKRQMAMARAQFEAQQEQEQQMLQQQMLMQMRPQQQIGHHMGSGLMGIVKALQSQGRAPDLPNVAEQQMGDDPGLARFNELMSQGLHEDVALEMVGQETGNAAMIADAQKKRAEREKASLEMEDLKGRIADRSRGPYKIGQKETWRGEGPDGEPWHIDTVYVGEGKGNFGANKEFQTVSGGPAGGTTGTPQDYKTAGGRSKSVEDIESQFVQTANSLDMFDELGKLYQESPLSAGTAGVWMGKAENFASGLKNMAQSVVNTTGMKVTASLDPEDYKWGQFESIAKNSAKIRSMILMLAYANAAANGQSGRDLSDKDVQHQLDIIGGSINNPEIFQELMQQNKTSLVRKLRNKLAYTDINASPAIANPAYSKRLADMESRVGMGQTASGQVTVVYPDGRKKKVPADHPSLQSLPEGYKVLDE